MAALVLIFLEFFLFSTFKMMSYSCRERGCEWFSLDVVTFPQLLRALCAA